MEGRKIFPEEKREIRACHKRLRSEMTWEDAAGKSKIICEKICASGWYEKSHVIYGYYPLEKEVDCRPVLEQALCDGKLVALPRTGKGYQMDFFLIESLEQVQEGNFHVMEPCMECPLVLEQYASVLVPGVVFDSKGNRYGYGKGYYDRYFSRFGGLRRIALAYDNQMEEKLAVLDTDAAMNYIYTESRVYDGIIGNL